MANIFELATRKRLRFLAPNGSVTTEDLWSMSLPQLDKIALALKKEIGSGDESFLSDVSKDDVLQLRFDVVVHIIRTLQSERAQEKSDAVRSEQRRILVSVLADREQQELASLSIEEIKKRIEALDKDAT